MDANVFSWRSHFPVITYLHVNRNWVVHTNDVNDVNRWQKKIVLQKDTDKKSILGISVRNSLVFLGNFNRSQI